MIGTGAGAQAYGHGIYVAERPGIAKRYEQNQVEKMQWDELYEERGELYDELEKVDFLGYDSAEEAFDDILRTRRKQGKDWVNSFDILEDHEWDKVSSGLEFEEVLKKQKKLYNCTTIDLKTIENASDDGAPAEPKRKKLLNKVFGNHRK